jgi:transposase
LGSNTESEDPIVHIASVGIDLGKMTFHLVALDRNAKTLIRKKFTRKQLLAFTANLERCLIGMEACAGAHFMGKALRDQGHDVRIIPAQFVKPYRKTNKNDFIDAEAIAEAVTRENMRFVPIKTDDQLDLQALHRIRERLVKQRTGLINQIRGFLLERGITFAKGAAKLRKELPAILEDAENNLTPRLRTMVEGLCTEWRQLDYDIQVADEDIERIAVGDENCKRLREIPGVGAIVSTAMVAAVGNGAAFQRGRDFAAWLGLVPKQHSTGDKTVLGRISKVGNSYLRRMFIHGARAWLLRANCDPGTFGNWVRQLQARTARNKVVVAIANKLARVAWAVLFTGTSYRYEAHNAHA